MDRNTKRTNPSAIFDPYNKLNKIKNKEERRSIKALWDILESSFGFNFSVKNGYVIEIQLVASGMVVLPRVLGNFQNLIKLELGHNQIKRLRNLKKCKSLRILNLSNNLLNDSSLEPLKELENLESLDLSDNLIKKFPNFSNLKKLKKLNLAGNKITSLNDIEEYISLNKHNHNQNNRFIKNYFQSLKFLNLQGNPIQHLYGIQFFPKILQIILDENQLSKEELSIYKEGIKKIREFLSN